MSDPAESKPPRNDRPRVKLHPEDEKELSDAIREAEKHPERLTTVSPEELRRWAETGEWPESSE